MDVFFKLYMGTTDCKHHVFLHILHGDPWDLVYLGPTWMLIFF